MKSKNIIFQSDSYKISHWKMLPEGTERVYSYGCARKGSNYKNILYYGMQGIIKQNLLGAVLTQEMIEEAKLISKIHLGSEDFLNIEGWQLILDEFGGKLPISIKSLPEGKIVEEGNVLFTIENTDDRFAWLTNYIEGILMKVYYPTVVATRSKLTVDIAKKYLKETSDLPVETAEFLIHDFGYRSCATEDAAAIAGSAHLINSKGTDTLLALVFARDYYNADLKKLGFSVAASEHSIATARGKEGEKQYIIDLMGKFPTGILSLVADSYSITKFLDYVEELKDLILLRFEMGENKGIMTRFVVRPDSPRFDGDTPEDQSLWIYEKLADIFGTTKNSKGYKVLHPAVGALYGDGLNTKNINDIYSKLKKAGFSTENQVVGQGGGLLMKDIDRDTIRFAIKCSAQKRNGEWVKIQKNPLDQSKKSFSGKMKLIKQEVFRSNAFKYSTILEDHPLFHDHEDQLVEIFRDGELLIEQNFEEIRKNANANA